MSSPDQLARRIHGYSRLLATQLDNNSTVIVTDGNALLAFLVSNAPSSLEAVVERLLKAICVGVPDT